MKDKRYARVIGGASHGFMIGSIVEIIDVEEYRHEGETIYNYETRSNYGNPQWILGEHLEEVKVTPK